MTADRTDTNGFPTRIGDPAPGVAREADAPRGRTPRRRLIVVAAGFALLLLTLLPAVGVGAQSVYPPNTVISTYYDARYGTVSVVTDSSGNLIDVNAATGQRIYPVFADYSSAYTSAFTNAYVAPSYVNMNAYGYPGIAAFGGGTVYQQYTDNSSNCTDGQVTQTASGYYCTATGTPAFRVG